MMYSKCSNCGEIKPSTEFHKSRVTNGRQEYSNKCKTCTNVNAPIRTIREEARILGLFNTQVTCKKCKQLKNAEEFGFSRRVKTGIIVKKVCLECLNSSQEEKRENPKIRLRDGAKMRAKREGIEYTLELEDFEVPEVCPVLGIPLERGKGKRTDNSPTVDRINPKGPYSKENIKIISWRANRLKGPMSLEELRKIYEYMRDNYPEN